MRTSHPVARDKSCLLAFQIETPFSQTITISCDRKHHSSENRRWLELIYSRYAGSSRSRPSSADGVSASEFGSDDILRHSYLLPRVFVFASFCIADPAQTEYCPTFHCSSLSWHTGMTSQLFSIIWWFRAWKPCIFWKYVILHKHLDNRLPALDIHVTSCQMKYWQRFCNLDMRSCLTLFIQCVRTIAYI